MKTITRILSVLMLISLPPSALAGLLDEVKEFAEKEISGKGKNTGSNLAGSDVAAGLKDALRISSAVVVENLGKTDGFNSDPLIRIPLPKSLQKARGLAAKIGAESAFDDLELKLNRAAEAATPKAKQLFQQAIQKMTLKDAKAILNGPDDAATRYFQNSMSDELAQEMKPVVENSLSEVGAIQSYDKVLSKYKKIPFAPDIKADLTKHVVNKGMSGIFHYIAEEEKAIRNDPAKRTTELLKKVFGK